MASYFSGIMVRLMLTLAPVICVLAAIAVSVTLERIIEPEGSSGTERSENVNNEQAPVSQATSGENIDDPPQQRQEKSMASTADDAKANMVRVIITILA